MSRNFQMTWDGSPNFRWKKIYRGQRVAVKCEELGLPKTQWTKEGSYAAANAWWDRKKAELGAERIDPDRAEAIASVDRKIAWASNNEPSAVKTLQAVRADVLTAEDPDTVLDDRDQIAQTLALLEQFGVVIPPDLDPTVLQQFFGNRRVWQERHSKAKAIAKDKTVKAQMAAFLASEKERVKPQTYNELRNYLLKVQGDSGVLPAGMSVERITEQTVSAHYTWLAARPWKPAGKNKALGFFRRFVNWLWDEKQLADLPRNLKKKAHRFKIIKKKIKTWEPKAVKAELEALSPRLRLWALLGLNCGMTNCDLGALVWEMIDMKKGVLTRKRVKTEDQPEVPEVTYKLWPETMALLKELPLSLAGRTGLVFTAANGSPMYSTRFDGDVARKKDLFALYWQRSEATIPLKAYRSITATILNSWDQGKLYVEIFLGHAPATVAMIHYAGETDSPFFVVMAQVRKTILKK